MGSPNKTLPNCARCPLKGQPKVLGAGDTLGGLMIIGEAPGATEVVQEKPFVGVSGQLLRRTLKAAGVDPATVWYTNACLCRPPDNADPPPEAIVACSPRLGAEVTKVQPKKILLVGGTAYTACLLHLTGRYVPATITTVRGRSFHWGSTPTLATYHPAACLRAPENFREFADDIEKWLKAPKHLDHARAQYVVCTSLIHLEKLLADAPKAGWISLDTETTGTNPLVDRLLYLGIGLPDMVIIVPSDFLATPLIQTILQRWLKKHQKWTVGHNARFDSQFLLRQAHIDWHAEFDTMLGHYLLNETKGTHSLKDLARYYFDAPSYGEGLKPFIREGCLDEAPQDEVHQYLAYDCAYTRQLATIFSKALISQGLMHLWTDLLRPADRMLRDVELTGIAVDQAYLRTLEQSYVEQLTAMGERLQQMATAVGYPGMFNPRSPQKVARLLYDLMGLKTGKRSRSVDRKTLELLPSVPVVEELKQYRLVQKLNSTYVVGLAKHIIRGRVHPEFLLHGTVTGRLSCHSPSLQNIPWQQGPVIRNAFIASPKHVLIHADYSQLELRVAAFLSQDTEMIRAFTQGVDFHTDVAANALFHIPEAQITKNHRYIAKLVTFGIAYGREARSLAHGELHCSVEEAQQYINNWFERFSEFNAWRHEQERLVREQGFVVSAIGRQRRFPLITNRNIMTVEKQAVNAPIQSLASDICLQSACQIHATLLDAKVLILIHDAIIVETPRHLVDEILPQIRKIMETPPFGIDLPLPVEIEVGHRWGKLGGTLDASFDDVEQSLRRLGNK